MEQKFSNNSIDLQVLREFCEQEGEAVFYRKGDQMEREGDPSRWFGFVTEGCFKYVTHEISSDREHITWFSFEGEYVGDYPSCLNGSPAQTTIEAMLPSRVLRVTGEQLMALFRQHMDTMELRSIIAEHLLSQARRSYLELHRSSARELYELSMRRCPGIVEHLSLNAISSFLNITPQMLSKIRKSITFDSHQ
ncbi:MAG: cyclic nucleotide-binding domain-containing protein [Prevotella sp.]|nr:cyclic nucleotide-binding domain-containing protein [Prevotella sp.]